MKPGRPSMFNLPPPRPVPDGRIRIEGAMRGASFRAMVSALESVGYIIRVDGGVYTCTVNGNVLLRAKRGNRGTYLVHYAEGVLKLMEKKNG